MSNLVFEGVRYPLWVASNGNLMSWHDNDGLTIWGELEFDPIDKVWGITFTYKDEQHYTAAELRQIADWIDAKSKESEVKE